jgi:tetratricopeptide (TPR) repeat protein
MMTGKAVGRPERDLPGEGTPLTEFARRLRAVRAAAGQPSYRRLAAATHYSAATLARAAAGHVLPSLEVTLAYVAGCGGDPADWRDAWAEVSTWLKTQATLAGGYGPAGTWPAGVPGMPGAPGGPGGPGVAGPAGWTATVPTGAAGSGLAVGGLTAPGPATSGLAAAGSGASGLTATAAGAAGASGPAATGLAASGPAAGGPTAHAQAPVAAGIPAQLPPDTGDFTGRDEQIRMLCGLLQAEPPGDRPGAVVITAVAGMGGIGKTALAVHVAHRLRDRFPDGQLFANLQGATSPLRSAEVLARFLRDLGVPDVAIPAGEAERSARFRTLLAGRRVLVALDDARDEAQVRPLLPGSAGCGVIVTSRNTLPGLPGTTLLDLEVLDQAEAGKLFRVIVGPERAAAEPEAVDSVLDSCGGLPLAIRIAASRLASRPRWSITHLAARLADENARLAELTAGDLAVRASFEVSYETLPLPARPGDPNPARVFRLLGLSIGRVLSLPAIAALAGDPAGAVAGALDILTDAHLLQSPAPDRYRLHDLLRNYAAELAQETETAAEQNAAVGRVLRWYSHQAVAAAQALTTVSRLPLTVAIPSDGLAALIEPEQALDWYESELANLIAAARQAASRGMHDVAAQIACAMWGFFRRTPYLEDWIAMSQLGVHSARQLGDEYALVWMLNGLGQAYGRQGEFTESRQALSEALEIRRRGGDRGGEAAILNSLACDLFYQERFGEALEYLWPALAIHTSRGEQPQVGVVLNNIGHALLGLRRPGEALGYLGRALEIRQAACDRYGMGITESTLGDACRELGRFEDAVEHYEQARSALEATARDHADQADVQYGLGIALDSLGRSGEAREAWLAAARIFDRYSDPRAGELRARLAGSAEPLTAPDKQAAPA